MMRIDQKYIYDKNINQNMTAKEICPVVESIYAIGNKWSLVITYNLMKSPKRFNELKACIPGISSKVLTENLCELQEKGIIEKKTTDQPEKNEYMLTEKGEDLRRLMAEMRAWGEKWLIPPEPFIDSHTDGIENFRSKDIRQISMIKS